MFRRRGIVRHVLPALAALTSVVACSLALPLPAPAAKPGGTPFPCQHHACGCRDAESCWRDCCCFTPEEKIAWARRRGVEPPAFALAAARRQRDSATTCCTRACCTAAARRPGSQVPASPPSRPGDGTVLLVMALKCRGVQVSVTLMPPSLPVERHDFAVHWVDCCAAPEFAPQFYEPPFLAVATPPPDVAAA